MPVATLSARLLLPALAAALIAACAAPPPTVAPSNVIEIQTQDAPATACMAALLQGRLVRDPRSGIGLRDDRGFVWQVTWPFGYRAPDVDGRFEVVDSDGIVLAHEGDLVGVGGGEVQSGIWVGCGGIVPPVN